MNIQFILFMIHLQVLGNAEANKFVSGIGVHWYQNFISPPSVLTDTHNLFPDRFILATEACEGKRVGLNVKHSQALIDLCDLFYHLSET